MTTLGSITILAAGQGTRMRRAEPKVLSPLCGRPMIAWVVEQALALDPERVVLVLGVGAEAVRATVEAAFPGAPIRFAVQEEQRGTGHAVRCALPELEGVGGDALVLYGDMPCLRPETLSGLCSVRREAGVGVALLTALADDPRGFGRVLRGPDGAALERIVEERDASPEERAVPEVNVGVYAFAEGTLAEFLPLLKDDNRQGELYLTDVPALLLAADRGAVPVLLDDPAEAVGVNTLSHLAEARGVLQERILEEHLAAGVLIEDPGTTYVDWGVRIGAGSRILPCTVIRSGVEIGADCEVGPFTHLRVGTVLADGAEVGNFTEAKNARLGPRTKAKHLTYLGDVTIGSRTNIGAGTIVANYDGKRKHPTVIGDGAFVGSGTVLIAPSEVGDGALTGGGAIVTRNTKIPPGEAWVGVPARPLRRGEEPTGEQG